MLASVGRIWVEVRWNFTSGGTALPRRQQCRFHRADHGNRLVQPGAGLRIPCVPLVVGRCRATRPQRSSAASGECRTESTALLRQSLSRLWQRRGEKKRARQMLADVYGSFSEGFETADLREARSLLEDIG